MNLYEIVGGYRPEQEKPLPYEEIARIVKEHSSEILNRLETVDALPRCTELGDYGQEPVIIEKPVTIGDLTRHLEGATATTPEISLTIFSDGKTAMLVGDEGG